VKLKMAQNSLFAILLRSPWWISLLLAAAVGGLSVALLPAQFKLVGALSGLPFFVIAGMALVKQWHQPGAARVAQVQQALAGLAWPAFATLLEQAFQRDGYSVQRSKDGAHDFVLERQGRCMLVSAKRWKSAQTGLETLRALQAARQQADVADALLVGLGELSDSARPFAARHRIAIWQAPEIAQALRGIALPVR
jgi:restriction system protein